ncbi:MAG: hypothetical protein ACTSU7_13135 [Candidatus Heimdallarchaeaceae archaeon]
MILVPNAIFHQFFCKERATIRTLKYNNVFWDVHSKAQRVGYPDTTYFCLSNKQTEEVIFIEETGDEDKNAVLSTLNEFIIED